MEIVGTATFQPDIPWDGIALVLGIIVLTFFLVAIIFIAGLRRVVDAIARRRDSHEEW